MIDFLRKCAKILRSCFYYKSKITILKWNKSTKYLVFNNASNIFMHSALLPHYDCFERTENNINSREYNKNCKHVQCTKNMTKPHILYARNLSLTLGKLK